MDRQRYLPYRLNRVLLGVLAAVRPSLRKLNGEARTLLTTYLPSSHLTDEHEDGVVTCQGFTNR
jgi:hypothetical protein